MPQKYSKTQLETLLNNYLGISVKWSDMKYTDIMKFAELIDKPEVLIEKLFSELDADKRRDLLFNLSKSHGESTMLSAGKKMLEAWEDNRPLKKFGDKLFGSN